MDTLLATNMIPIHQFLSDFLQDKKGFEGDAKTRKRPAKQHTQKKKVLPEMPTIVKIKRIILSKAAAQ